MESGTSNLRVALYCRVSTEEQREGQTIDSQINELERFAKEKGWIAVGSYCDEGWSGSLLARPELDRLRDDASKKLFDMVLINDVDRLARDVTHLGVIKRDLERLAVRVIFRKLPGEQSPTHNLLVNILGSFAEFERELIADRTRRGRRHKVEVRQKFLGCIAPYGFKYIPKVAANQETGLLMGLPEEATIVRQMYRWVDEEGLSIARVVTRLNKTGLLPRKRGRSWQKSSVRRILRSEVYAGVWYYNKHQLCEPVRAKKERYRRSSSLRLRPRSEWLPVNLPEELRIVGREQWLRVQEQLNRNTSFSPRNARHAYLLSGLLRCGACKAAYVGDPSHGHFAYRCANRCKAYGTIAETSLNLTVWNAVADAFANPEVIKAAASPENDSSKEPNGIENEGIQNSLAQLETEESRILDAYRREILSPEQLAKELQGLQARRKILESRQSELARTNQSGPAEMQGSLEEYCRIVAAKLAVLDPAKRQQILRLLLRSVVFEGERVRIRGIIPLTPAGQIASTGSDSYARNVAMPENQLSNGGKVPFELIRDVIRDETAARTASLANLAKANRALKRRSKDGQGLVNT